MNFRADLPQTPNRRDDWLNPELSDKSDVQSLIDFIPDPHLVPTVVDREVRNIRNNGPELIGPA